MKEVQEFVDALAAQLGRPVGLDDRRFRALAYSSHGDDVDPVRRDSILRREAPSAVQDWLHSLGVAGAADHQRVPRNDELAMAARVCVPVRFQDTLLGFLWLIDEPEPLAEAALEASRRCAGELGAELFRIRQLDSEERAREAQLVRRLLAGTAAGDLAPGTLDGGLAAATRYAVLVAQVRRDAAAQPLTAAGIRLAAAAETIRRRSAPHRLLLAIDDEQLAAVLAYDDADEPRRRADALLAAAREQMTDGWQVAVGIGAERAAATDLRGSYLEARDAVHLGLRVAAYGPVVHWEDLGADATIAALVGDRDPATLLPAPLRRLQADRDAELLLATLEAYLEHAGDAPAAAAALFVHRASLYRRLRRIEDVAGVDLRRGDDRLQLQLGLRLRRLAGR